MPVTGQLLPGIRALPTAYDVANSLSFDSASQDHLDRTPASAGNQKKFTFSTWIKRSRIAEGGGGEEFIMYGRPGSNTDTRLYFTGDGNANDDRLYFQSTTSNSTHTALQTNRKFRDTSAWFNIVISVNTEDGNGSASTIKMFINGVQETSFATATYGTQNSLFYWTDDALTTIGRRSENNGQHLNAYLAETVLVDGQALDADSFGEFDADSPNIWKPIDVAGLTLGTNGFYLDYEDSSSLGNDKSGSNNFAVTNLTSLDQSTDTCTNNYATVNFLNMTLPAGTLSKGMLQHSGISAANYASPLSTIGVSQGKWYVEFKITDVNNWIAVGITGHVPNATNDYLGQDADSWGYIGGSSAGGSNSLYHSGSGSTYGATYANNDIIGVYLDLDNNKLYFAKNGSIQNSGTGISIDDPSTITGGLYFIGAGGFSGSYTHGYQANYGAGCPFTISSGNTDANGYGNFEYSPNDGGASSFDSSAKDFYALNTKNLSEFG